MPGVSGLQCVPELLVKVLVMFAALKYPDMFADDLVLRVSGEILEAGIGVYDFCVDVGN